MLFAVYKRLSASERRYHSAFDPSYINIFLGTNHHHFFAHLRCWPPRLVVVWITFTVCSSSFPISQSRLLIKVGITDALSIHGQQDNPKLPWRKTAKRRWRSGHCLENIGKNIFQWFMPQVKIYSQIHSEEPSTISLMGIEQLKIAWSIDLIRKSSWIDAKNSLKLLTSQESHWKSRKIKSDQESFSLNFNSMQKDTYLIQRLLKHWEHFPFQQVKPTFIHSWD